MIDKFNFNSLESLCLKIDGGGGGVIALECKAKFAITVTGDGDFLTSTGFPTLLLGFAASLRNSSTGRDNFTTRGGSDIQKTRVQ